MALGEGDYRYELAEGWAKLPEGWVFSMVSDAAIDSKGRIFAFTRGKHPIIVFDKDGNFVTSWGYGEFGISPHLVSQSHGIFIGPDDEVYLNRCVAACRAPVHLARRERERVGNTG